ncbi:Basic amino-acid permease [Orbilia ellipsospora]|uniref:Basic amino-acid permease n=1 Tax=Orbilia ellipsospora TaxID=2528407 RepID=A0AAV9WUJ1_9PEZI
MRFSVEVLFFGSLISFIAAASLEQSQSPGKNVSKEYIIVLKDHLSTNQLLNHTEWTREVHARVLRKREELKQAGGRTSVGLKKIFNTHRFKAYAGSFDTETLNEIEKNENVDYVEEAKSIRLTGMQNDPTNSWSLSTISHRVNKGQNSQDDAATFKGSYRYDSSAGEGTYAYVIDSGVNVAHNDFEGRAECGYNALHPESSSHNDTVGHGTHVAGIIASKSYGVAKKAKVISVKVIDRVEYKRNTASDLLDGINWAANDISKKNRSDIAVINLSMAVDYSRAINDALNNAYKLGILSIVAAGNLNVDVEKENMSPAMASKAFVVGATAANNTAWVNSNYGKMVDIMAPGVQIKSLGIANNDATAVNSGTSMAAPHVAGLVCYLRRLEGPKGPEQVTARLLQLAQRGVLDEKSLKGSPNVLAFNGSEL